MGMRNCSGLLKWPGTVFQQLEKISRQPYTGMGKSQRVTICFFAAIFFFCLTSGSCRALSLQEIRLPPGFKISVYAEDVHGARSMALGARGTLFVSTRSEGKVYALVDRKGGNRADEMYTIATGLDMPNGIDFHDGSLYVAEVSRILRYERIEEQLGSPPKPVIIRGDLPRARYNGWRYLRFGPDGLLYLSIGAPCNVCTRYDERFASIVRMNPDGKRFETFAKGVRHSMGFDWSPGSGELWFTDIGRDWMGDNEPPDELNRAPRADLHFGFPFCHGGDIPDPEYGLKRRCREFVPPAMKLWPHVASLGMRFYTGRMFPQKYRNQIFIAEYGSWNRRTPIGYRVTLVEVEKDRAIRYSVFAEGWLHDTIPLGRPVDLLVMPDGALLVSDDYANAIYRISYGE